ncbi:hypothetical protein [Streptomyces sp. NPDC050738]|uniref:hypothetical protein n=1 Tax=Streptomyces sp. NPDC050738 TaxID=3154744 RepID=UPI003438E8F9
MSHEAAPEQVAPAPSVPEQKGAPKGLLQQMEELMASLNADLSQLDADLQSSTNLPQALNSVRAGETPLPAGENSH